MQDDTTNATNVVSGQNVGAQNMRADDVLSGSNYSDVELLGAFFHSYDKLQYKDKETVLSAIGDATTDADTGAQSGETSSGKLVAIEIDDSMRMSLVEALGFDKMSLPVGNQKDLPDSDKHKMAKRGTKPQAPERDVQ